MSKFLIYTLIIALFFACAQSDSTIEQKKVEEFARFKPSLDKAVFFAVKNYYSLGTANQYTRLQFVLNNKTFQKGSIFSDTTVTNLLSEVDIIDISFEKSSQCLDKYEYDLVRFKLENKGGKYQYYYVYEFCPLRSSTEIVNTPNFKSISLGSNWYLDIEKN